MPPPFATAGRRAFLASGGLLLTGCGRRGDSPTLACAAGWRAIVAPAVRRFERRTGTPVRTLYDGSGRLVSLINLGGGVDLFLAADRSYLDDLRRPAAVTTIRRQRVRCVRGRDAADVTLRELVDGTARVSLASAEAAAVGRVLRRTIGGAAFESLRRRAVSRTTVTEVAADVGKLGAADYGFVWDTTWPDDRSLVTVPMPELRDAVGEVAIGRLGEPGSAVAGLEAAILDALRCGRP